MRKNRKHQKNEEAYQLELFTRKAGKPEELQTARISRDNLLGDELLSELKRQQTLTNKILEEILYYGNLKRSYAQVKKKRWSKRNRPNGSRRIWEVDRKQYKPA